MTSRERVLCALNGIIPDRVPYMEIEVDEVFTRRLLGECNSLAEIPEAGFFNRDVEREKLISCLLNRDNITYQLRAPVLARKEKGKDGRVFYGEGLIKTHNDLKLLERALPDPSNEDLYQPAIEFIEKKGDFAACAGIRLGIAPTILSLGIEGFAYALYDNPDLVDEVLTCYTQWSAAVVERLCSIGFDFIWASDDIAFKTGPLFSPHIFRERILPRLREVAQKITIPWVYHSDGNVLPLIDDLLNLGMNALHPIEPEAMDITLLKRHYGDRICLVGNIDVNLLTLGTPYEVEGQVKARIREVATGGRYIVSSSNSITSYCDPQNVLALGAAVKKYGNYDQTGEVIL